MIQMSAPTHLYKYQRLTAHSLASLLNETVWLSSPAAFNDPFDCAITLSRDKFKESLEHAITEIAEINKISREQIENHDEIINQDQAAYEQLRNSLRTTMQKIGVLCLSATPHEILMWSHYTDCHKGFCVEYDFSEGTQLRQLAQPVRYSETIPDLSLANLPGDAEVNFIDVCIFTKAKQWEYEQEWRVIMHEGNRIFQAPSKVTSVIFGSKMPTNEKVMIHHALRNKAGISFKQALLPDDRFAVDFGPFSV